MALPRVLDSHGLANEDPRCSYNVPMHDKKVYLVILGEKKKREWFCPRDSALPGILAPAAF